MTAKTLTNNDTIGKGEHNSYKSKDPLTLSDCERETFNCVMLNC